MRISKLLLMIAALTFTTVAFADTAYISGGSGIYRWDTNAGPIVTVLPGSPTGLDSLIFDTHGNIVFTQITTGRIGSYNPTTDATTFFSVTGNGVADMALDPSGTSVLVSDAFSTTIQRIDLTTGNLISTFDIFARPDGLAYDASGDLFAVRNLNSIVQLNPSTGAILKTLVLPAACGTADALTFDSTTGKLYASCDINGGFVTVDTNLNSAVYTALPFSPDGIASTGNTLYFVSRNIGGVKYDLTTNTITQSSDFIPYADDIAPLAGLGSPAVPEPASLLLLTGGIAGIATSRFRKRSR